MFFILSETLQFLVHPLPLLFLALLGVVMAYHRRWARSTLLIVVVAFYGLSIPYTSDRLMQRLEVPRVSYDSLKPEYDVVIVLGGMVDLSLSRGGHLEFTESIERILTGVDFIKRGIGKVLLVSGGSGNLFERGISEAKLLRDFAIQAGLTAGQVLIEPVSRNTYENAVSSASVLREHHYQRILLITSAFHMRRAAAAFHKQGITPDIYPVDFQAGERVTPFSFVPSTEGLDKTKTVIRELVGLLVYRLRGYI